MARIQSNLSLVGANAYPTAIVVSSLIVGGNVSANPRAKAVASEDIPRASLIYINGAGECALADASAQGKEAVGFANAAYTLGQNATYLIAGSIIYGLSGLTPQAAYFMSAVPGEITPSPPLPSDAGYVCLKIGTAISPTELLFMPETAITM